MLNIILLICFVGGLVGFLIWRRTPRTVLFGALFFSTWIYVIAFWLITGMLDQLDSSLENGVFPYIASMLPVVGFLGWFLRGTKHIKK